MALDEVDADELRGLIAVSRKRALSFGLCLAGKPDKTALLLHRLKKPDILARTAKKEDGVQAAKATHGTVETKGKTMTFRCHADVPAGAAKNLRLFLRAHGMPMKVILLNANGQVAEADGEDTDLPAGTAVGGRKDDQTQDSVASSPPPSKDPLFYKWTRARAALKPQVASCLQAATGDTTKIRAAWIEAEKAGENADYQTALTIFARLAPALTKTQDGTDRADADKMPDEDLKQAVAEMLRTVQQDLEHMPLDRFPDSARAHELFAAGVQLAKAGDLPAALKSLIASTEALAKVKSDQRVQAARETVPDGMVKQMASQMEAVIAAHRARRLRSIAGLDALILALASEDDTDLLEIATRIESLRRDLPEALEEGLARIHTALLVGDNTAVQREKKVAQSLVADAAKFLNAHQKPLKLCEANPFGVKLNVLVPLSEALQAAQKSLAKL